MQSAFESSGALPAQALSPSEPVAFVGDADAPVGQVPGHRVVLDAGVGHPDEQHCLVGVDVGMGFSPLFSMVLFWMARFVASSAMIP